MSYNGIANSISDQLACCLQLPNSVKDIIYEQLYIIATDIPIYDISLYVVYKAILTYIQRSQQTLIDNNAIFRPLYMFIIPALFVMFIKIYSDVYYRDSDYCKYFSCDKYRLHHTQLIILSSSINLII